MTKLARTLAAEARQTIENCGLDQALTLGELEDYLAGFIDDILSESWQRNTPENQPPRGQPVIAFSVSATGRRFKYRSELCHYERDVVAWFPVPKLPDWARRDR